MMPSPGWIDVVDEGFRIMAGSSGVYRQLCMRVHRKVVYRVEQKYLAMRTCRNSHSYRWSLTNVVQYHIQLATTPWQRNIWKSVP